MDKERRLQIFAVLSALVVVLQGVMHVLEGGLAATPRMPPTEQEVARGKIVPFAAYPLHAVVAMRSRLDTVAASTSIWSSRRGQPIFEEVLKVPFCHRGPDVPRKSWKDSSIYQAIHEWPDREWQKHFRLKRPVFNYLVQKLVSNACIADNICRSQKRQITAEFKVAVAIFHLAHGGTWFQTAMAAGISADTVRMYTRSVCEGIVEFIRPEYMRKPTPEELVEVQRRFADGRGIANVGGAVPAPIDSSTIDSRFYRYCDH